MKSFILPLVLILFLTSCITSNHVYYSDPNYLNSDEFSTYEKITTDNEEVEKESFITDTTYSADDYYDYSFSSRIRRFHRPIYYSGYYGGIYTDYYWYNNDPLYCGASIYYGYNWYSPYYSYYNYSPYYYGSYYSYGYSYHHSLYNKYYTNSNVHNSYITGHRTSLSSNTRGRNINTYTTNKISKNTPNRTSTLNIRSNNTIRNNTINNQKLKGEYTKKTNNRSRPENSNIGTIKTRSNRKGNPYSTAKKNNRSYNLNGGEKRSNTGKNSSGGSRRSLKPRR